MMRCPVCSSERSDILHCRERTAVFQNTVFRTRAQALSCPTGRLEMRRCEPCGFIWNAAFDSRLIDYAGEYDNSQVHSEAFVKHLNARAARIRGAIAPGAAIEIAEIGCGQGDFLKRLMDGLAPDVSVRAVGFDPAYRGGAQLPDNVTIYKEYFSQESVERYELSPDIIISRHTIEHVPDPRVFLSAARAAMDTGKQVRLFLETPDSGWIIEHQVYHDFFYEHCSLFNFQSIAALLRRTGLQPQRVERCFGGQYLWVEAQPLARPNAGAEDRGAGVSDASTGYAAKWAGKVAAAARSGKVGVWGAGAKGATFVLLTDRERQNIAVLIDSNPGKQGGYLPVTGHPIVAPRDVLEQGLETIFAVNPVYVDEIRKTMSVLAIDAALIIVV